MALAGASPPREGAGKLGGETKQLQETAARPAATAKADGSEPLYAACQKGEAKRDSDLCAQWYAADSAYEASVWARRTGWFTGLSLIVGAVTMGAAIAAAMFARDAANHSQQNAAAAWATEEHARRSADISERSVSDLERPYLVFVPQPDSAGSDALTYQFANYGRTPCVIIGADVRYLPITPIDAPDPLKPNLLQAAITPDRIVVPPNAGASTVRSIRLGKPVITGAERADMTMVHGYAIYRSTSGHTYACGFGLYRRGEDGQWKALNTSAYNYDEKVEPGWHPPEGLKLTVTAAKPDNT